MNDSAIASQWSELLDNFGDVLEYSKVSVPGWILESMGNVPSEVSLVAGSPGSKCKKRE